jgi:hypothetical protein
VLCAVLEICPQISEIVAFCEESSIFFVCIRLQPSHIIMFLKFDTDGLNLTDPVCMDVLRSGLCLSVT